MKESCVQCYGVPQICHYLAQFTVMSYTTLLHLIESFIYFILCSIIPFSKIAETNPIPVQLKTRQRQLVTRGYDGCNIKQIKLLEVG